MSTHASRLHSPRFQRTLTLISAAVLFAGALTFVIVYFGDEPTRVNIAGEPGVVPPPPQPTVKLDPQARLVAAKFLVTAVTRQNLAASWKITHPSLRAGYTYKQWLTGTIPVQPYPAKAIAGVTYKVESSHPNEAVINVLILPKRGAGIMPQTFFVYLKAVNTGKKKRWLVEAFVPSSGALRVPSLDQ
jgi:hypothetical protein